MRRVLRRTFPLLLGIVALVAGGWLFLVLNELPWRLALTARPLYADGPLERGMAVASGLAGVVALLAILRLRTRRGLPWRTAVAAGVCLWLLLWGLFPTDPRQVPPLLAMLQAILALALSGCGLHVVTGGRLGRGLLALWDQVLGLRTWVFVLVASGAAFAAALVVGLGLFRGAPVINDGNCYLYLAHLLTLGRVHGPVPVPPDLVDAVNVPFLGGESGWIIQHPPGYPALLALGVLVGLPWIVNPLLHAVLVWLLHGLGREVGGRAVGRGAALLGAASPFLVLWSGTFMAHTAAIAALTGFAWAMVRCRRRGWAAPVAAGLLLGAAIVIRPYSALLVAFPFAVSGICRLVRRPRWYGPRMAVVCLGLALPVAAFLLYNQAVTGSPWKLGYQVFHGTGHDLGFGLRGFFQDHRPFTPWMGFAHTQHRVGTIQEFLLLWPVPLFLLLGFAFATRAGRIERLLLAGFVCVAFGYAAYFNRGDWLCDPRFLLEGAPGLLVVAALAVRRVPVERASKATLVAVCALTAIALRAPVRLQEVGAHLMRDRVRVDPAVSALEGRSGILFLDRELYRAAPGVVADPRLKKPLLRAKARGRADERVRAFFSDRRSAYYLAADAGGLTAYEEVARLEALALRPLPEKVQRLKQVELGSENTILALRAGTTLRLPVTGGPDRALAWGWFYRGPPRGGVLVVRTDAGAEVRLLGDPPEEWRFRSGFLPLPDGVESVAFTVEGRGGFGIVDPDLIRARIVTRYGAAAGRTAGGDP
jgi:hypothetical protein